MELVERPRSSGAVGATISGRGPAVLFWCHWEQTGGLVEACEREAPDCVVRRVTFAPGGADVESSDREPRAVEARRGVWYARAAGSRVAPAPLRDWTLPKGKLDPGETFEEAALREVEEETGPALRARARAAGAALHRRERPPEARALLADGRRCTSGAFEPNDETDELRWMTPDEALALLTYERDREFSRRAAP